MNLVLITSIEAWTRGFCTIALYGERRFWCIVGWDRVEGEVRY